MKSFERWWMKYYKIAFLAGLILLVFRYLSKDTSNMDAKGVFVLFAVVMSPIGALIGQILEWLFKLLHIIIKVIIEFVKLKKAEKKS